MLVHGDAEIGLKFVARSGVGYGSVAAAVILYYIQIE